MHKRIRAVIPILLVVLGLYLGFRRHELAKAEKGIYSGTIEARESRVGSTVGGRVSETLVREGDTVRRGQLLILFESDELAASLRVAVAAEKQASDRLSDLEAGARPQEIEQAQAAAKQAESQLLKLTNGSRPEEIAAAKAAMEESREKLALVKRGPRQEDIDRAKSALDAAKADRELADQSRDRIERIYKEGAVSAQAYDEAKARANVAAAQETSAAKQLEELKAGSRPEEIRAAEQAYSKTKASYLLVQRGARQEDIDAAREAVAQSRAAFAELLAGTRPYQIEQARSALKQASATVAQIKAKVRERAVFAPKSGQLQVRNVEVGDIVSPGQTVGTIIDPRDLYIKIYVPAGALANMRVGTRLSVVTDSGLRIDGVVEQIPVGAEFTPRNVQTQEERELQVYAVKIRLPNASHRLRAGMSASIRLNAARD